MKALRVFDHEAGELEIDILAKSVMELLLYNEESTDFFSDGGQKRLRALAKEGLVEQHKSDSWRITSSGRRVFFLLGTSSYFT